MELFDKQTIAARRLFEKLYQCQTEQEVDKFISRYPKLFDNPRHWRPLGGNESNFGVVEN